MEFWRHELYNTLSHSVEGSSWKDHKYVAIVNGKYIYPEDLKENTDRPSSNPNTKSYALTLDKEQLDKTKKISTKIDTSKIEKKDKGRLLNKNYLPTNPEIGDMYTLNDTGQQIVWTGNEWAVIKASSIGGSGSGGGATTAGNYGKLKPETIARIRNIISGSSKKGNVSGFGGGR